MRLSTIESESSPSPPRAVDAPRFCDFGVALFVLMAAIMVGNQIAAAFAEPPWLNGAWAASALLAAIAALAAALPWPNVLLAGGLAAFIGGLAEATSAATGFPLGAREWAATAGPAFMGLFPCWLLLAWPFTALASRGAARFLLYRRRSHSWHGVRVICLATALAGVTSIGLEWFVVRPDRLWLTGMNPWFSGAGSLVLHALIQVVLTPLLIDKFPGPRPRNVRPVLVWVAANLVLLAGIVWAHPGR